MALEGLNQDRPLVGARMANNLPSSRAAGANSPRTERGTAYAKEFGLVSRARREAVSLPQNTK
jgi:hypothetical protein